MRLSALLVGATGCAQIFGINNTTSPDVGPSEVTAQLQRVSIGATVVKTPYDLSKQTGKFLVENGAGDLMQVPAMVLGTDTFAATIPTGTPPVLFTLPDAPIPYLRLWSAPSRVQKGNFLAYEHALAADPSATAAITVSVNLPTPYMASEALRVEVIGAWTGHTLAGAELPAAAATAINTTIMYSLFPSFVGAAPKKISTDDVVLVERYLGNQLTGYYKPPPFMQSESDTISGDMMAVTPDQPLSAAVTPMAYTQRFAAVRPAVTGGGTSWALTAAPGYAYAASAGVKLHAGAVAATDTMINTMYANPFDSLGWHPLVFISSAQARTFSFSGVMTSLGANMYTAAEAGTGLTFDMPAGLPITMRVNQMPLTIDGAMLPLDLTMPVEFDAQFDRTNNSAYQMTLWEMVLSADMMRVENHPIVDAITSGDSPKFRLPPELLMVDHYYFVTFRSMKGGLTGAATGDLQTVTLPISVAAADSAVFKVTMP